MGVQKWGGALNIFFKKYIITKKKSRMDLASGGSGNSLFYVVVSKSRFVEIVWKQVQKIDPKKKYEF